MEIILTQKVEKLGREGDIVRVSDGYARNFLLPRKLGTLVNAGARRRMEKIRLQREEAEKASAEQLNALAERIGALALKITVKVGEGSRLYGSVTTSDIADAMQAEGVKIDRHQIELEQPIKELGSYDVKVTLRGDIEPATVKVAVVGG